MPTSDASSTSPPPLWPSLVIAGTLAIAIPVTHFFVSDPFGFTLIFLPIYIPLAFGILWPLLIACQGPIPGPWLDRHKVALALFLASVGCSALWFEIVRMHFRNEAREESQKQQELRAARDVISAKGLLAFSEPLNPGEADALIRYVDGHLEMPASELLNISEKYQDQGLMRQLVRMKRCPPEALKMILDKTVKNSEKPMSGLAHAAMEYTFLDIAHREDTPPEVLSKLLKMAPFPEARLAALKNPQVDRSGKIAYEQTLCPRPPGGSYYEDEFQLAASDADAPPSVLQCFASDRAYRLFVATNPRAPIELLEQLTRPEVDEATRKAAQENIQKRGTAKP